MSIPGRLRPLVFAIAVAAACVGCVRQESSVASDQPSTAKLATLTRGTSHTQVQGAGIVTRLLPDDQDGSTHQKFIIRLQSGQTLLIAHNTDLAPAVGNLRVGDTVEYSGEYEWNPQGGVVHWTHRDPAHEHADGWLKHDGRVYQ